MITVRRWMRYIICVLNVQNIHFRKNIYNFSCQIHYSYIPVHTLFYDSSMILSTLPCEQTQVLKRKTCIMHWMPPEQKQSAPKYPNMSFLDSINNVASFSSVLMVHDRRPGECYLVQYCFQSCICICGIKCDMP